MLYKHGLKVGVSPLSGVQAHGKPGCIQQPAWGAAVPGTKTAIVVCIAHLSILLDNSVVTMPHACGSAMTDIETSLEHFPLVSLTAGEYLLTQDNKTDGIYFLSEGSVRVTRHGHDVAVISDKGAVFGDICILLGIEHSASVQCLENSKFYYIEHPRKYLEKHPEVIWHIAQILALRLFNLTQYLVDVKNQYEGHDHLGMVDDVLETLLNQQKTKVNKREHSKRDTPDY